MMRFALLMTAFFGFLHLLGARAFVSALSGTLVGGTPGLVLGLLYTLCFLVVALLVPPVLVVSVGVRVHRLVLTRLRVR